MAFSNVVTHGNMENLVLGLQKVRWRGQKWGYACLAGAPLFSHRSHRNGHSMWFGSNPPKFLILFSGKHNQEKRSEMQSRSALLSAIKFRLSCSAQPSCRFKNMLCSWLNHHVAKKSNAMEGENEAVRYLWCYPNGFTKDIHKALVAQIQKKIKQYEIDSLSPFWEFFSQYFASRVCWFCTSTSASASFQTGSMFCVLFIAGSFSSISNFPSYSLDREHRYDVERKRCIWSPLYLVTDWHGMSPLKTQKIPV